MWLPSVRSLKWLIKSSYRRWCRKKNNNHCLKLWPLMQMSPSVTVSGSARPDKTKHEIHSQLCCLSQTHIINLLKWEIKRGPSANEAGVAAVILSWQEISSLELVHLCSSFGSCSNYSNSIGLDSFLALILHKFSNKFCTNSASCWKYSSRILRQNDRIPTSCSPLSRSTELTSGWRWSCGL